MQQSLNSHCNGIELSRRSGIACGIGPGKLMRDSVPKAVKLDPNEKD